MKNIDPIILIVILATSVIVGFIFLSAQNANDECAAKGGVNVKTSIGTACVKLERIQ